MTDIGDSSPNVHLMVGLDPGYHAAATAVLEARPNLAGLLTPGQTMADYLAAPLEHQRNDPVFGGAAQLAAIIVSEVERVHGGAAATQVAQTLETAWSAETGAHVSIPRCHDKVGEVNRRQVNDLVVLGQIAWAATRRKAQGTSTGISLATGIVPPSNANSARYLDFSLTVPSITLPASSYKGTPEFLIPPLTPGEIDSKLTAVRKSSATAAEKAYASLVLEAMRSGSNDRSFADQALRAHAVFMDSVLPEGDHHVSVDSVRVASLFMAARLRANGGVLKAVFDSPELTERLRVNLVDIQTGWRADEGMFLQVYRSGPTPKLREANVSGLSSAQLADALEQQEFVPRTLLQYATMILEGGLSVTGGMNQAVYCSQLQERLVTLITEQFPQEYGLAGAIAQIPLDRAVISPAWSLTYDAGEPRPTNALDLLCQPLSRGELHAIADMETRHCFAAALPTLASFLAPQVPPPPHMSRLAAIEAALSVR